MTEMQRTVVPTPDDLLALAGVELGVSSEFSVSQEQVNDFADLTGDHQWIHVDVERAAKGPFGSTIAHGFFTLAMVPVMFAEILQVEQTSMGVNYGLDRVRFVTPVKPDEAIRARAQMLEATSIGEGSGVHATARVTLERVADVQVCCVADIVFRYYK